MDAVEVDLPEGAVVLTEVRIVHALHPDGESVVALGVESYTGQEPSAVELLGILAMTQDTILHPPTGDES